VPWDGLRLAAVSVRLPAPGVAALDSALGSALDSAFDSALGSSSGGGGGGGGERSREWAVRDVTLHCPGGKVVVVVGGPGSGKSALLDALAFGAASPEAAGGGGLFGRRRHGSGSAGLPWVSSGGVQLQGRPRGVWGATAWREAVGTLRQGCDRSFGVVPGLTVAQHVAWASPPLAQPLRPAAATAAEATGAGAASEASVALLGAEVSVCCALALAGLGWLPMALPHGVHTVLEAGGGDDSGGSCGSGGVEAASAGAGVAAGVVLPGGAASRLGLARALAGLVAGSAGLVLLDEPTAACAEVGTRRVHPAYLLR